MAAAAGLTTAASGTEKTKYPLSVKFDDDDWGFVLELFDVTASDAEVEEAFRQFRGSGFKLMRLAGTAGKALAIFDSRASAQEALRIANPSFKMRPMKSASQETRTKIRQMGLLAWIMPAAPRTVHLPDHRSDMDTTSGGLRITPEIRKLCRSVDMRAVVEALSSPGLTVNQRVDAFLDVVTLTPDDLEKYEGVVRRLEACFRKDYPDCSARLFGSCVAGLALKGSDLDVYLDMGVRDPSLRKSDVWYVEEAARILRGDPSCGFEIIRKVPNAQVPIVKLFCRFLRVSVDVSFSNSMGVVNSTLIKSYVDSDPDVRRLVLLVRWWFKVRGISGRHGFLLTSYSVVWLALFYLMTRERRPRVPSVARVVEAARRRAGAVVCVNGWECGVAPVDSVPEVAGYPPPGSGDPLTSVLEDFFEFYSKFDFAALVISPFLGRPLPRVLFGAPTELLPKELAGYLKAISKPGVPPLDIECTMVNQDPFRLNLNLNRNEPGSCEKAVAECKSSLFAMRHMAPGTPQEGVFSLLQLALDDRIARGFGPAVYNGLPIPPCEPKPAADKKVALLSLALYPAVVAVVELARGDDLAVLLTPDPDPAVATSVHGKIWRELVFEAVRALLVDGLLFDTWDLTGLEDLGLLDAAAAGSRILTVPVVRRVGPEAAAALLEEPVAFVSSHRGGLPLPPQSTCDTALGALVERWKEEGQGADGGRRLNPLLSAFPVVKRSSRAGEMITRSARSTKVKNRQLVKRFYCEARWPTCAAVRRDGTDSDGEASRRSFLDTQAEWSSVIARNLSGDEAADDPTRRPPATSCFLFDLYAVGGGGGGAPFTGLLVAGASTTVSPLNGAIGDVKSRGSVSRFVRDAVARALKDGVGAGRGDVVVARSPWAAGGEESARR